MSLFSIVQGQQPPLPAPVPQELMAPMPPPVAPVMPPPQMNPMMNLPARIEGGGIPLADASWGQRPRTYNLPAYGSGGHQYLDGTNIISALPGDQNIPLPPSSGAGGGETPPYSLIAAWRGITGQAADTVSDQQIMMQLQDPGARTQAEAAYNASLSQYNKTASGGGGADNSLGYAQMAQQAMQWEKERADRQAENIQSNKIAQQQASQDYYTNLEAINTARRGQGIDAGKAAMDAFTANVGYANIPGIENWNPFNGDIAPTQPTYRIDPSLAVGTNLPGANIPAPTIPDLVYGGQQ